MTTVEQMPVDQRFLLPGVSWQTYLDLREHRENGHVRMIYDRGVLEMMTPSKRHEQYGYLIGRLIDIWTEELNIDVQSCRTVTFKNEDIQRGLEPDNCYYIAHEFQVRNKDTLDLSRDPPPDLAVEIDMGSSMTDKMSLYATFKVPEVWRYDGQSLAIHVLDADGRYFASERSASFPQLPPVEIEKSLHALGSKSETAIVRSFRAWIRKLFPPSA
ncbi:MAG: Uma2 family endonuclease [Thermoguttaceae bacterium]